MSIGAAAGIGALVGGIAGSMGGGPSQETTSRLILDPETKLEGQATKLLEGGLTDFQGLVNAGAGQQDVANALTSQRGLAALLQQYSQSGGLPTAADYTSANGLADQMLNPAFRQQEEAAARLAAQMNRPVNDPIIQAKLRQGLADQRSTFVAQQAMNMPLQRLGFTQQLADVNNSLATQAMSNRQALMSLGSSLREQDRAFRINTAGRQSNTQQFSPVNFGTVMGGALSGAGAGASFANMMAGPPQVPMQAAGGGGFNLSQGFQMPTMGGSYGAPAGGSMFGSFGGGQSAARASRVAAPVQVSSVGPYSSGYRF